MSVKEIQKSRFLFLSKLYEKSGGDYGIQINAYDIGEELGLNNRAIEVMLTYFSRKGLVEVKVENDISRVWDSDQPLSNKKNNSSPKINPHSTDEVKSKKEPDPATRKFMKEKHPRNYAMMEAMEEMSPTLDKIRERCTDIYKVSITHEGIDEVEAVEENPQRSTKFFPANIIYVRGDYVGGDKAGRDMHKKTR